MRKKPCLIYEEESASPKTKKHQREGNDHSDGVVTLNEYIDVLDLAKELGF